MKNRSLLSILLILFIFSATDTFSQLNIWTDQIGSSGFETSNDIYVDNAGNSFITGSYSGTVDFNPGSGSYNLTSAGMTDVFVVKIDVNGNMVWAISFGGANNDEGVGISLDNSGNIYVTGFFQGTADFDPSTGTDNIVAHGEFDVFLAKFDANGNHIWANKIGGTNTEKPSGIDVSSSGNVYITGYFQGNADFDPTAQFEIINSEGADDVFLAKYDANGAVLWAFGIGGINNDYGKDLCVDNAGNCYITGLFTQTADFDPGTGTASLSSFGGNDAFVAKYNTSGTYQWAFRIGGGYDESGNGIATDNSNVYLTGYFQNIVDFDPSGTATYNLTATGSIEPFIAKYSSSGVFAWAGAVATSEFGEGIDILVGDNSNVYTVGTFSGNSDFDPSGSTYQLTANNVSYNDVFMVKWSSAGSFLWAANIGSDFDDVVTALDMDNSQIFVTGMFLDAANFGTYTGNDIILTSAGGEDIFVALYDQAPYIYGTAKDFDACEGENAYIKALYVGSPIMSYQWSESTDGSTWLPLSNGSQYQGVDTDSLTILAAPYSLNNRMYSCIISNFYGTDNTGAETLAVFMAPPVDLGPDQVLCAGSGTVLDAGPGYTYLWDDNSTGQQLNVVSDGTYSVTITNGLNCTSTDEVDVTFSQPYAGSEICLVTVDTSVWKNMIIWERTINVGIDYYKVYRLISSTWDSIGYVPFDSMSVFIDMSSNPNANAERYKISVVDTCGNESALSPYHQTINLSKVQGATQSEITLIWNIYEDESLSFLPSDYHIYRGMSSDNMTLFFSLTGGLSTYNYNIFDAVVDELFQVLIDKPSPCIPSNSLKVNGGPYSQSVSNLEDNGIIGIFGPDDSGRLVSVYPNPANDAVTLDFHAGKRYTGLIEIVNISGEVIYNCMITDENKYTMSIKEFEAGFYIIKTHGNITATKKLIIE